MMKPKLSLSEPFPGTLRPTRRNSRHYHAAEVRLRAGCLGPLKVSGSPYRRSRPYGAAFARFGSDRPAVVTGAVLAAPATQDQPKLRVLVGKGAASMAML